MQLLAHIVRKAYTRMAAIVMDDHSFPSLANIQTVVAAITQMPRGSKEETPETLEYERVKTEWRRLLDSTGAMANMSFWDDDLMETLDGLFNEKLDKPLLYMCLSGDDRHEAHIRYRDAVVNEILQVTKKRMQLEGSEANSSYYDSVAARAYYALTIATGRQEPLPLLTRSLVSQVHHILDNVPNALREVSELIFSQLFWSVSHPRMVCWPSVDGPLESGNYLYVLRMPCLTCAACTMLHDVHIFCPNIRA